MSTETQLEVSCETSEIDMRSERFFLNICWLFIVGTVAVNFWLVRMGRQEVGDLVPVWMGVFFMGVCEYIDWRHRRRLRKKNR